MNRLIICGLLTLTTVYVTGCGPSLDEQRNIAASNYQVGRFDEATSQFEQIVERHPADSASYLYLARIYRAQKRYEQAIYNYQRALTADASNSAARRELDQTRSEAGPTAPILVFHPEPTSRAVSE
jgi:tetratricopeptide (TPR) repeat protein